MFCNPFIFRHFNTFLFLVRVIHLSFSYSTYTKPWSIQTPTVPAINAGQPRRHQASAASVFGPYAVSKGHVLCTTPQTRVESWVAKSSTSYACHWLHTTRILSVKCKVDEGTRWGILARNCTCQESPQLTRISLSDSRTARGEVCRGVPVSQWSAMRSVFNSCQWSHGLKWLYHSDWQ